MFDLEKQQTKILGYKKKKWFGISVMIQNPSIRFLLWNSEALAGEKAYIGFFEGRFPADIDMKTKKGSQEEPDGDKFQVLFYRF